jgi:hypothetical protein
VAGAVEQLGERAYTSLATPELRASARRMLVRLADTGGEHAVVRRRATRDELESVGGAVAPSVLDLLAERRLITVAEGFWREVPRSEERGSGPDRFTGIVEVAHEALLTEWKRLRDWLAEDATGRELRAHLTPTAAAWVASGDDGELYRGARLAAAQDWVGEHAGELTEVERDFVEASSAAVVREQLSARRTVRRLRPDARRRGRGAGVRRHRHDRRRWSSSTGPTPPRPRPTRVAWPRRRWSNATWAGPCCTAWRRPACTTPRRHGRTSWPR